MKLTKQQLRQIIQEELQKEGSMEGHSANVQLMQEKAMDIIMAMQPEELAQLLSSPIMQMAFQRLMGAGKY